MTDTLGRMHPDAQFAGSSSVPAHVEMMGFLGIGNNPMVGATVAIAVAIDLALNKTQFTSDTFFKHKFIPVTSMSQGFFVPLSSQKIPIGTHIRLDDVRKVGLVTVGLNDEESICVNTSFCAIDKAVALMP